jgi:aspartyl/asparaginyl beta-hydroxylase (cupin superfamily)
MLEPRSRRRAFYDWTRFAALAEVRASYRTIAEEARRVLAELGPAVSQKLGSTYALPLVGEPEERHPVADKIFAQARALSPVTSGLLNQVPYVVAFAFSYLPVGASIPLHEHWNPYLVAALCLQGGGSSHILVGGERRDFQDGEFVVFDYSLPHESHNQGAIDRIVLLVTINPRLAPRPQAPPAGVP